jgi:Na+-driven multidrug efflux pump
MNYLLPGILFGALADGNKQLLICMGHQNGPMIIFIIASILHYGICYGLTHVLEMGVDGPPIA